MKSSPSIRLIIPFFLLSLFTLACAVSIQTENTPVPTVLPTILAPTENIEPTTMPAEPVAANGSIRGKLSYPSELIPPMRVVAFRVENGVWTQQYAYVDTLQYAPAYQIDGLEAGKYWIVAYILPDGEGAPSGLAGGYSQFVPCGLNAACTDHNLIEVSVNPNQITENIDPADWYAPQEFFPPNPAP